jgi:hypothetical protein
MGCRTLCPACVGQTSGPASTSRRLGQRLQISVDRKPDKMSGPSSRRADFFVKVVTHGKWTTCSELLPAGRSAATNADTAAGVTTFS